MGCDFKQFSRITIYILHKRIYFCNIFHQKKFFFLGEIIFRGYFQAQKALFCVVLVNILPAKCDVFLKIR